MLSTLSLILVLCRIVINWDDRNEIIVILVRSTNEVGTGTPSENDGKDKSITPQPLSYNATKNYTHPPSNTKLQVLQNL